MRAFSEFTFQVAIRTIHLTSTRGVHTAAARNKSSAGRNKPPRRCARRLRSGGESMLAYRIRSWALALLCAAGCPAQELPRQGLISIQDLSVANLPQAGHGLSVQAFFTPLRAPDYEEQAGVAFGCKVSLNETPPRESDQGRLHIAWIAGGPIACRFAAGRGYVCPTASGRASARVTAASTYVLEGASPTPADVGRYLQISGADRPENNGAFA